MADQLATLGITVNASGAISEVQKLDAGLGKLGVTSVAATHNMGALNALQAEAVGKVGSHSLALNRLERNMSSVLERTVGLNSSIGLLGSTFLKFGVGDIYTVAIIGGLAAISAGYDVLTRSAREAQKAQDDAYRSATHMLLLKAAGAGGQNQLDLGQLMGEQSVLRDQRAAAIAGMGKPISGMPGSPEHTQGEVDAIDDQLEALSGVIAGLKGIVGGDKARFNADELAKAQAKLAEAIRKREEAEAKAQAEAIRYAEFMKASYGRFGGYSENTSAQNAADLASLHGYQNSKGFQYQVGREFQDQANAFTKTLIPSVNMPNVGMNDGLTKEQIRQREKLGILVDDGNKNAEKLKDAIWGSAAQMAGTIVSALNIGGGGKGSSLGGALGGTAGFAIGFSMGGPVGGAIGSTIGNVAGSLLGGLFDHHKKAIDSNTQALNNLTATLSNAPSGFKAQYYNYNAADPRAIYQSSVEEARKQQQRGGKKGFALQASL